MLTLKGKKTTLEEFSRKHLEDPRYMDWLRDLDVIATINRIEYMLPIDPAIVPEYVASLQASDTEAFFAILDENGEFVGTARIAHIDWRMGVGNIGVMIGDKQSWGKGLATDVVRTLADYAFNLLSLRKLISAPSGGNVGMCRCFEKVGFRREGCIRQDLLIRGEYFDRICYGMFRDEFEAANKDAESV